MFSVFDDDHDFFGDWQVKFRAIEKLEKYQFLIREVNILLDIMVTIVLVIREKWTRQLNT